jgi:hypothetical protein
MNEWFSSYPLSLQLIPAELLIRVAFHATLPRSYSSSGIPVFGVCAAIALRA